MRPILVTGSSGVLGSYLVKELQRRNFLVHGIDIMGTGQDFGDICNRNVLAPFVERSCGIVHCAAIARVQDCEEEPNKAKRTNIYGTKQLVEIASKLSHKPWIIFISSREVYGFQNQLPILESSSTNPQNLYAKTKIAGEHLIQDARKHGIHTAIVRLTNLYGALNDIPARVIPSLIQQSLTHSKITLFGTERIFDFLHISDAVKGIIGLIPIVKNQSLEPLLLCSGIPITLQNLAELIIEQSNSKSQIYALPRKDYEVKHFYGVPQKIFDLTGWKPCISLQEGLAKHIYLQQQKEKTHENTQSYSWLSDAL